MRKKIHIVIKIILLVLMVLVIYGILPETLADIMKEKVEVGYDYRAVYKTKINGEYDISSLKIGDSEGIEKLWELLEKTEVSFKAFKRSPNLMDGEVWYEITDMQHIKSIQITNSGEVYAMAFRIPQFNVVYSVSDGELKEFFETIEEIRVTYGEE